MTTISTRLSAAALAWLTTLAMSLAAQSGPRERDVWYEYVHGDLRYGYQHERVIRQADGTFRYVTDLRMLIDLFSSQKQEIRAHTEFVVDAALRPISVLVESKDLSGESRVAGRRAGDKLVLEVHRAGTDRTVEISCPADGGPVFFVCVGDRLAGVAAETKRVVLRYIDEDAWNTKRIHATRKSANAWTFMIGEGFGHTTIKFDERGVLEERLTRGPDVHLRRCTEALAKQITHRDMDGRELLTFPLDKSIGAPERLRELIVRLRWQEIPFDEFELEDGRQQLIRYEATDKAQAAVLRVAPPKRVEETATIPFEGTAHARYLAETHFIKPGHPDIVAAARKAVGNEANAAAAVRALARWVNDYIEGELVATTLSGPEVLACKRGKCTEYSTLFASLARAVGIPTRIALGERMMAGRWMGHMWNEAYVGHWVTVDASVNEVGESFALLKFVHSDTVMGTQSLRWKLTRSLSIAIEKLVLAPSALEAKYKTGVVGSTYTNTDHACRLVAPGKDWTLEDKSKGGAVTVRCKLAGAEGAVIHFVAFSLGAGSPPKLLIDARLKTWRSWYDDLHVHRNAPRKVAGASGHMSHVSGMTKGENPQKNATTDVIWVRGKHGYLLSMIALDADHEQRAADFEKLLAGFSFLAE